VDISEINEGRKPVKKIYMKNYGRPAMASAAAMTAVVVNGSREGRL